MHENPLFMTFLGFVRVVLVFFPIGESRFKFVRVFNTNDCVLILTAFIFPPFGQDLSPKDL